MQIGYFYVLAWVIKTILDNNDWLLSYLSQKYFRIKKEHAFESTTVLDRKCTYVV